MANIDGDMVLTENDAIAIDLIKIKMPFKNGTLADVIYALEMKKHLLS